MGDRVDAEITGGRHDGGLSVGATGQRVEAGHQDGERERFGEVVIGAGVERLCLVEVTILGGEHEHRGPDLHGPKFGTDLEAVLLGQHEVEHEQVVTVLGRQPQPLDTIEGELDGEPVGFESTLHERRDLVVVRRRAPSSRPMP
jgi:hypothetical protein